MNFVSLYELLVKRPTNPLKTNSGSVAANIDFYIKSILGLLHGEG